VDVITVSVSSISVVNFLKGFLLSHNLQNEDPQESNLSEI